MLSLTFKYKAKGKTSYREIRQQCKGSDTFKTIVQRVCIKFNVNPTKVLITSEEGYLIDPRKYTLSIEKIIQAFGKIFIIHLKKDYLKKLKMGKYPNVYAELDHKTDLQQTTTRLQRLLDDGRQVK